MSKTGFRSIPRRIEILPWLLAFLFFCTFPQPAFSLREKSSPRGYRLDINGAIGPVTYYQVKKGIRIAEEGNADFLLIVIDTPGGLLSSTRKIVQEILESRVPVIAYVYPRGAQCASAGTFIALSCHAIAMSPATNIGAAHPVSLFGASEKTMEEKVVNDTVSFIKSIAILRNRNGEWAERAVRESLSSTEEEALAGNVIDAVASGIGEALSLLDGKKVKTGTTEKTMRLKGAGKIILIRESFRERILSAIANPTIAYILLLAGIAGIILEFLSPGIGLSGIIGAVSIILAFFAMHVMEINAAGLILIIAGIIFLAIEAFTPSFGLFAISGMLTILLGSLFLFSPLGSQAISHLLLISLGVIFSISIFLSIKLISGTKARKVSTGKEGMIGETGKALTALDPEGMVFVHGEYWKGISESGKIEDGEYVEVTDIRNSTLILRKSDKKE